MDVEKINFANKLLNAHKQELARQIDMGNAHKPEVRALDATLRKFSDVNTQYQSIIDELNWLPRLQKEAKFNYDLQVATSDLIIRKNPDGTIYKVYQEMHNIGPTLETYLKTHAPSDAERLELAIKLLLLTDDLHTGKLSRTGKPYAHRDIKEPNILIDEDDNLHFIDFGFTIDSEFNVEHIATQGTPEYLPISFKQENTHLAFKAFNELRVETTPSFFFDDKVAVLRTIYSQAFGDGIFTEQMFDNLPDAIWKLICSHNIPYLKHVSSKNTLKFIATALIIYECVPEICTKEILEDLSHNLSQQEEIIRDYTKTRENSRGKDLATIQKLLLDKKVFLDYLPYNYRIRTNMEPSYLQFLLENSLLTSNSMLLLSKKLNSILYKNHLERSLVLAVLNDQDFLTMHLQEATLEDINSLLGSIYNEQILSADELLDLHVEAFALNKIVPALIGTANISEVFYRLVHKSIFTNEIKDANFLEKHCDIFAFDSSDKIEFNVEQAKLILEQTQILKPHIPSDPNLRTSTDQFIQKFLNLSARYCNDLDSLPSDKESPEYADIKIAFAFIIRIHMAINELENEKINETEFADKIDSIGIIYEHEVKNNPSIKELFDPKYAQQRISPVSVTTQGIFDVSHAPSKHSHSKDAADDSTYAPKTRPDKK